MKTDCGTRQRLPLDQQDPAYQHPGVQLDQGLYDGYSTFWLQGDQAVASLMNDADTTCAEEALGPIQQVATTVVYADYDDCAEAIADLLQQPDNTLPIQKKDHQENLEVTSLQ